MKNIRIEGMIDSKIFLKSSLIFQMSLGSKELFHSNVWAWLIEKENQIINVFFDINLSKYQILGVDRERKNRDIIIWLKEYDSNKKFYLLIENKIKSLPQKTQLEKYTTKLWGNELLGAVFTGLINPFNEDLCIKGIKWRFVNYNNIANNIEKIVKESTCFNYGEQQIIIDYCKVIFHIDRVLTGELKKTENKLSYDSNGLGDLRIGDLFIKLKGATFIDYLKKRENEFPQIDGYALHIDQSFHNGKATLDVRYTNWKSDMTHWLCLGVQLEGCQYRKIVERGNLKINNPHIYVYDEFEQKGWFDKTFDKYSNQTIFGKKTSMKCRNSEKFDKYTGDNYCFVYQYYDITNECNEYDKLFLEIKNDLIEAKKILESIK